MRSALYMMVLICTVASCKKEPVMPMGPEIELLDIGPTHVVEFGEHVTLRFSYKDGNGDLGRIDPHEHSLWVKDSRLADADGYHIPPLTPPDTEVAIQGELSVQLHTLFLLGNSGEEELTYTIRIQDRAGNWSNELISPPITVVADTLGP